MSQIPSEADEVLTMQDPDSVYRKHLDRLNALITDGGSLSGHERNCAFLNIQGKRFATVSSVSGLDHADDSRSPVYVDWDHDGDLDLWVANRTAPQLRMLRNDSPQANHYLSLRLRGTKSNRDGIGARVEVWRSNRAGSIPLLRTLKAGDGFLSQSTKWLHFGLGTNEAISRVVVHWPGGVKETFSGCVADQHYRLEEGQGTATKVKREAINLNAPDQPAKPTHLKNGRIVTSTSTGLPPLRYQDPDSNAPKLTEITLAAGHPVLINLWASWCNPCIEELKAWKNHGNAFAQSNLDVYALAVDELDDSPDSTRATAAKALSQLDLPFRSGFATEELFQRLEQAHNWPYGRRIPMPVPTSFLVDAEGRLKVIYRGTVSPQQVIDDLALLDLDQEELQKAATPFPGRWVSRPVPPRPVSRGIELMDEGDVNDAAEFIDRNLELLRPHKEFGLLAVWVAEGLMGSGETSRGLQFLEHAARSKSSNLTVINNLAWQYAANPEPSVRKPDIALRWAAKAVRASGGNHPSVLDTLAVAHAATGDYQNAILVIDRALRLTKPEDKALIKMLKEHRAVFESGQPYIDPPAKK